MADKSLVQETLKLLNLIGVNPLNQNVWTRTRATLTLILFSIFIVDVFLELIINWNGPNSLDTLSVFIGLYLVESNLILLIVSRKKFSEMLSVIATFWSTSSLENYGEIGAKIKLLHGLGKMALRIMVTFASSVVITFYAFSTFSKPKRLPAELHFVKKFGGYETAYWFIFINAITGGIMSAGHIILFMSLIINIICELKIIKLKLKELPMESEEESFKVLKEIIERHNLVLTCVKNLDNLYSFMFLNQFLWNILCICATLLTIITGRISFSSPQFLKFVLFLSFFGVELFIYCLQGSALTAECISVSDAAYESKWWQMNEIKFRKALVLIIQRAQRREIVTAGGVFPIDMQSFTRIVNTSISFFSVMRAFYRNE